MTWWHTEGVLLSGNTPNSCRSLMAWVISVKFNSRWSQLVRKYKLCLKLSWFFFPILSVNSDLSTWWLFHVWYFQAMWGTEQADSKLHQSCKVLILSVERTGVDPNLWCVPYPISFCIHLGCKNGRKAWLLLSRWYSVNLISLYSQFLFHGSDATIWNPPSW